MIVLDGASLTGSEVAAIGRREEQVEIASAGLDRARAAAQTARRLIASSATAGYRVYGRTTGVGANRGIDVRGDDAGANGLRLLRSHVGGAGPLLSADLGVAMLAVRANQIAAGGSGVDPGVLPVLAECVNLGLRPPARSYGAIGTGDLAALAVTALCLLGERDWLPWLTAEGEERQPRFSLDPADALAFISSGAVTAAEAAMACHDLVVLVRAGIAVAALSHLAVAGSAEPYAEAAQRGHAHSGQRLVAAALRELLADETGAAARIQDPYGYRALPQVHGPALDALAHADQVITTQLNAAAENPLVDTSGGRFWHNGNFHAGQLGLALDTVRAAVFQASSLSAARLGTLLDHRYTGLTMFLAHDVSPSSGLLILEYTAHSAVATIRGLATPAVLGSAVLSAGAEEHASFATQAAQAASRVVEAYRIVLACELVAAIRALRLREMKPAGPALRSGYDQAAAMLPGEMADRPVDVDLLAAQQALPALASLLPGLGTSPAVG